MSYQQDSAAIAEFLLDNPQFFEEHSELLAKIKLTSPLTGRAVSLPERQMEVLRDKVKMMELRLAELLRIGQENDVLTGKFHQWTCALLQARNDVDLPHTLVNGLQSVFDLPHATLRIWGAAESVAHAWFAAPVSDDVRIFANSLTAPYCGPNQDFEAVKWFDDPVAIQSVAMLPLRTEGNTFGLLVLGSPDAQRFTSDMGTDFLTKIGETASAALSALLA